MNRSSLALGLALPLLAAAAPAQELKVGMDAPKLTIAKWVKGDAVPAFQPGKVYIVEFWATWCGPCIASMPHLSRLQAEYKDKGVTIIGVTSQDDRGNTLPKVEAMVAEKGDGMGYTVAWDDGRKTSTAYLDAARQNGIPCSFLVDGKGKLAYIGHPILLDTPLAGVLAGTWDPAKDKVDAEATFKALDQAVDAVAKDGDKARGALDAAVGKNRELQAIADQMLFGKLMQNGAYDRAAVIGAKLVDRAIAAKDADALNQVAWGIVDPDVKMEKRDLDLAMKAASKAVEFTKEQNGAILDTLARVWFWKQDYQKALEVQKKAVAADPRPDLKKSLEEYEGLVKKAGGDPKPGK
jgi:thiol-disulfide isomerase/thioredoxin